MTESVFSIAVFFVAQDIVNFFQILLTNTKIESIIILEERKPMIYRLEVLIQIALYEKLIPNENILFCDSKLWNSV